MDGNNGPGANNSSDFVRKLYKMLETPTDENVLCSTRGRVEDLPRRKNDADEQQNEKFTKHILPKHFKHSNFASFVRQLNKYDFHKVRHNNEEGGSSPYGAGAWEFKHPDFKANNKDALDNIRRKAPAPRKPNQIADDLLPTQQMDLFNTQLVATQHQLQILQERYNELSMHHSMLLQELIGMQKTVVNHEHVMQYVMNFLQSVDGQRRRESRIANPFAPPASAQQNGTVGAGGSLLPPIEDDTPASPLQHAAKLLSETNADAILNPRNLEHMNEVSMRMNNTLTTPPPDIALRNGKRSSSRGAPPHSAASSSSIPYGDLDHMVYPVGHTNGIDPMYSEHVHNIPYPMPTKPLEPTDPRYNQPPGRKKSTQIDPGWIRQPQILLVEDDPTCRRIGGKFLYAFHCSIDTALDGLEAVNKLNGGSKYDLVLMDIIMPNLDGVSACHLIRQFDATPIIAMTSNIRSDDISMYFQHGMNDVLPKPFTKEGLLSMLEKHLAHLKKQPPGLEHMVPQPPGPPQALAHTSAKASLKSEESPATSPATVSNWNSPVGSSAADEYAHGHPGAYGIPPGSAMSQGAGTPVYATSPSGPMGAPRPPQPPPHRRQISEITGGPDDVTAASKRQQIYGSAAAAPPPMLHQPMGQSVQHPLTPLQRPRP
ncbi:kinase-regulated stress-responsive transcription factor skn7 [Elasticomyces elasticus]|nr:kinase-regulated stress-responsive transcription factor skn7 [Elasticomyces elasticus]